MTSWPLNEEILHPSSQWESYWGTEASPNSRNMKSTPIIWSFAKGHQCHSWFGPSFGNHALFCHVCTRPRNLCESRDRNKNINHSYLLVVFYRDKPCFFFGKESVLTTLKKHPTCTGPDRKHICIKGHLEFNINSLTQIFSSWQLTGKKGHRDPNCTIDVKQICVHTQTKSWGAGRL